MKDGAAFLTDDQQLLPTPTLEEPGDVYRWAMEQADHVRAGRFHLLDREHLADEIEDVARSEFRSLVSNLEIVLTHILKWNHQPTMRTRSWTLSIDEHRLRISDILTDSPSLKARAENALERAYRLSRRKAANETGLAIIIFAEACPYTWTDVMQHSFALESD